MLQVYKHNLRKTEYFFLIGNWFYTKNILSDPFLMLCYIIHLNQEIKSETKMLCL